VRRFLAVGQRPQRRRVCLVRSRLIVGHVFVLLIAAHNSVPAHFISPTRFGLQEPKDFGSHGSYYAEKMRDRHGVLPYQAFHEASLGEQAGMIKEIEWGVSGRLLAVARRRFCARPQLFKTARTVASST